MNKKVLFGATVAAVLASCSSDNLSVQTAARQEAQGLENAVSFEALSQRSLTRAGYAGAMDNAKLQEEGFGVFGYYTDLNEYDQTSTPNFMYNQKVSGAGWTYSPIKYWPNEYGSNAQSDDVDKLTFFAYAPYTENVPATGKVTGDDQVGITGFTRATAAGDPYVKYVGSLDPTKCVDLCWGVADPNQNVTWNIIQGGSQTMTAGMPWMNVQRPQKSLGQKMKFFFKHALTQLNVQIDADVNTDQHGEGDELDGNTKVFVRSITFNGFAMKGALNLNNEEAGTPNWKGYNCSNEPLQSEEYTVYDGMKDGKEGTGYTASNEKVTGLNKTIIQSKKWSEQAATDGVTKTAKNLFNGAVNDPIYVIPTGDDMTVTIVYDIETADEKLLSGTVSDNETPGVSIGNRISKTIKLDNGSAMKLEAGKKYTIQLHLGMSQVEFKADVADWDDTAVNGEAWLPGNGKGDVYATGITLDRSELEFKINLIEDDVQLIATVSPEKTTDKTVKWSSSDPTVATVDQNGLVHPLKIGTTTITAMNSADQTATCAVNVTKAQLGITISGDDAITAAHDFSGQLTATISPDNAKDKEVIWSSSKPEVLEVDQTGKVTFKGIALDASEEVTITAKSHEDETVIDSKTFRITPGVTWFIASNGKAYTSKNAATVAGTAARAWIGTFSNGHGLAFAVNPDTRVGGGTLTWNTFNSRTNSFRTAPSESAISALPGSKWRWPSISDLRAIWNSCKAGNYAGNPVENTCVWSTTKHDSNGAYMIVFIKDGGSEFSGKIDRGDGRIARAILHF